MMRLRLVVAENNTFDLIFNDKNNNQHNFIGISSWAHLEFVLAVLIIEEGLMLVSAVGFFRDSRKTGIVLPEKPDNDNKTMFTSLSIESEKFFKRLVLKGEFEGDPFDWSVEPLFMWSHVEVALAHFVMKRLVSLEEVFIFVEEEKKKDLNFPEFINDVNEDIKRDMENLILLSSIQNKGELN